MDLDLLDTLSDDLDYLLNHHVPATESTEDTFAPDAPINQNCDNVLPHEHQQSPPPIGQQQIHLSTQPAAHQTVIDGSYQMVGQPSINGQQHQQSLNIPETLSTSVNHVGANNICSSVDPYTPLHQPHQQSPPPIGQQQIHLSTQPAAQQTVIDGSYQMVGQPSNNGQQHQQSLNIPDTLSTSVNYLGANNICSSVDPYTPLHQPPQTPLLTAQQPIFHQQIPSHQPISDQPKQFLLPTAGPVAQNTKPLMLAVVPQQTNHTQQQQQQQQTATVFAINPNLTSQPNQLISAPSDTLPQGNVPTPSKRKGCESRQVVEQRYRTNVKGGFRDFADYLFGPQAKPSKPEVLRKVLDQLIHLRSSNQRLIEEKERSKEEKERLMEENERLMEENEKLRFIIQKSPLFGSLNLDDLITFITTIIRLKEKLVLQSDISAAIPSTTETRNPSTIAETEQMDCLPSDKEDTENVSMKANDLNGRVRSYSDENFRDLHDFVQELAKAGFEAFKGWVEDDLPIDEHCQATDRSCSLVTGHSDDLGQLHTEATVAAQLDAASTAAAYEDEGMETGPAGEPVGRQEPAPGETCSSHQSKDKVRYTPCGHLWCCQCVNIDETYHEKCPVCLKPDVQIRVYEPETVVMPEASLEQRRRVQLARAYMFSRRNDFEMSEKIVKMLTAAQFMNSESMEKNL